MLRQGPILKADDIPGGGHPLPREEDILLGVEQPQAALVYFGQDQGRVPQGVTAPDQQAGQRHGQTLQRDQPNGQVLKDTLIADEPVEGLLFPTQQVHRAAVPG